MSDPTQLTLDDLLWIAEHEDQIEEESNDSEAEDSS
jgi:hypothetical protein